MSEQKELPAIAADEERRAEEKRASEREIHLEQVRMLAGEEYDYAGEGDWFEGMPCIDGAPEWCELSPAARDGLDDTHAYRTVFAFGSPAAPKGWEKVVAYTHSGETACYCQHSAETEHEHEWGHEAAGSNGWPACTNCAGSEEDHGHQCCQLCDGDGLIYIGDGWCETIYRASQYLIWPEEGREARHEIMLAFANALHWSAWSDCEERGGRSPGPVEISDVAPERTLSSVRTAIGAVLDIERAQGKRIEVLYLDAITQCGKVSCHRWGKCDPSDFGHYVGMQWLGTGVSWGDDHPELAWHPGYGEFHYFHPSEYGDDAEDWNDPDAEEESESEED